MRFTIALVASLASVALATPEGLTQRQQQDPETVIDPQEGKAELLAATNASAPNLVYVEVIEGGLLEVFNDPSLATVDGGAVERDLEGNQPNACGDNTVHCSTSNRARTGICGRLFDILGGPAWATRDLAPYSHHCWSDPHVTSNNRCCMSWNRRVSGGQTRNLFSAAKKTMNRCKKNALVSGWSPDVRLGRTCVKQCLSNRPNGC